MMSSNMVGLLPSRLQRDFFFVQHNKKYHRFFICFMLRLWWQYQTSFFTIPNIFRTLFLKNGNFFYKFYLQKFSTSEAHNSLKPKIDIFFTNIFFHYINFFLIFYPFHEKKCLTFFQVQILFYFEAGNFFCKSLEYIFFSEMSFFMILNILWTFSQLFQKKSFEEAHNIFLEKLKSHEKSSCLVMKSHDFRF